MATEDHSQYLALGDVHSHTSPSSFDDTDPMCSSASPPPPVIITSRPAKKRKSWGQELPEPKTTLPPRKRAKTDDEKEQRRIERIKRNRAAAHNSRERKRQETETLAVALARANAELDAYRKLHGPLPASIVLPEVTVCTEDPETPAPSLSDSRSSIDDQAHSPATPETIFHINDHIDIKQEPSDLSTTIQFTPKFVNLDAKPAASVFERFDPTQHSAVSVESANLKHEANAAPGFPDYDDFLVDTTLPLHHDAPASAVLPHAYAGALGHGAFADGAFDPSFSDSLFSWDDLIDDSAASVAVDARMSGAV